MFKTREKNRVVDSIESSGEVKECQKGDFAGARSKQQLVVCVEDSNFRTVVSTVGRLERDGEGCLVRDVC